MCRIMIFIIFSEDVTDKTIKILEYFVRVNFLGSELEFSQNGEASMLHTSVDFMNRAMRDNKGIANRYAMSLEPVAEGW